MYKRIMAAIDDNFATAKVLDAAISLALKFDAKLAICHALDVTIFAQRQAPLMLSSSIGEVEKKLRDSAQVFLDQAVETARVAGIVAEIKLVDSEEIHVPEMLVKAAADWKADLLVVGTQSQGGVERLFVGSVAQALVGKATTSLLLVRRE